MQKGKVAIITGASNGIGAATTRAFANDGISVIAVARSLDKLEALAKELKDKAEVVPLALSVTDDDAPAKSVELAMKKFGRLDYLFNNAGGGSWSPVHSTPDKLLDEVWNIDLRAPFRFCRDALGVMKAGSSIVNMGSGFGLVGGMEGGFYCAAKAGIIGLTQTMAVQYGAQGIRTNCVAPGVIKTDMTGAYWEYPAFKRINQEMTPFNREGTPEDVANTVLFLCSDAGGYINGQTIAIDGGWSSTKFLSKEGMERAL
jgi:NAD(P)-dependent dehydrogenase (short-subunit alcohol dehydrogenase family)